MRYAWIGGMGRVERRTGATILEPVHAHGSPPPGDAPPENRSSRPGRPTPNNAPAGAGSGWRRTAYRARPGRREGPELAMPPTGPRSLTVTGMRRKAAAVAGAVPVGTSRVPPPIRGPPASGVPAVSPALPIWASPRPAGSRPDLLAFLGLPSSACRSSASLFLGLASASSACRPALRAWDSRVERRCRVSLPVAPVHGVHGVCRLVCPVSPARPRRARWRASSSRPRRPHRRPVPTSRPRWCPRLARCTTKRAQAVVAHAHQTLDERPAALDRAATDPDDDAPCARRAREAEAAARPGRSMAEMLRRKRLRPGPNALPIFAVSSYHTCMSRGPVHLLLACALLSLIASGCSPPWPPEGGETPEPSPSASRSPSPPATTRPSSTTCARWRSALEGRELGLPGQSQAVCVQALKRAADDDLDGLRALLAPVAALRRRPPLHPPPTTVTPPISSPLRRPRPHRAARATTAAHGAAPWPRSETAPPPSAAVAEFPSVQDFVTRGAGPIWCSYKDASNFEWINFTLVTTADGPRIGYIATTPRDAAGASRVRRSGRRPPPPSPCCRRPSPAAAPLAGPRTRAPDAFPGRDMRR